MPVLVREDEDCTDMPFLPQVWCDAALESGELVGSLTITLGDIYTMKHQVTAVVTDYEASFEFNITFSEVSHDALLS